jgi:hypothetical protein
MPVYVPQELLDIRLKCAAETCAHEFPIPFKERQARPIEPIFPMDYDKQTNDRYWVCQSTQINCPNCGKKVTLALPLQNAKATITLFVDEAKRQIGDKELWLFAASGADSRAIEGVCERLRTLKRTLVPNIDPDTWRLHMTELWHGDERKKHPVYSRPDFPDARRLVKEVAAFIRNEGDLFKIVSFSLREKSALAPAKRTAFQSLLIQTIHCLTERGAAPELRLDAERPKSLKSQLTAWSEEVITEQRHLLLFPFLTRGIPIPKPAFVKPTETSCVEVSDFIAFWTARTISRRLNGLSLDFDLGDLGTLWYFAETISGNLLHYRNQGLPWAAFFPGEVAAVAATAPTL